MERMLSLADQTLWLLTTLVEVFVVFLFFMQGLVRKFLFFNLYLLLLVTADIGRYAFLYHFGIHSTDYFYFYYETNALLTVALFISIGELSMRLVGIRLTGWKVFSWCAGTFLATALFSFTVSSYMVSRVAIRFLFELSQNLYFFCCLAVLLLWAWKLRNEPEDRIAASLVNVLSIYFLLFALTYGARQLASETARHTVNIYPMIDAWLPLGSGFALCSRKQP